MARTKGAKTVRDPEVVTIEPSRCRQCSSTKRSDYKRKTVHCFGGVSPGGFVYDRIIYRPTRCLACGQWRTDRTFEFVGDNAKEDKVETDNNSQDMGIPHNQADTDIL